MKMHKANSLNGFINWWQNVIKGNNITEEQEEFIRIKFYENERKINVITKVTENTKRSRFFGKR